MRFVVLFSILLCIVTLSAQDQVLSLQQGTLRDWTMQKDTMMKISAAMPRFEVVYVRLREHGGFAVPTRSCRVRR